MQKGLYVFGGKFSKTTFDYFPTNGNIWQEGKTAIPNGFSEGCGVRINSEELVLIGGKDTEKRVLKFNTISNTFTTFSNLTHGRYRHSCTVLEQNIIVAGGRSSESEFLKTEIVSIIDGKVTMTTGHLNAARYLFGLVTLRGSLVLAFGGFDDHNILDSVEQWNQETQQWKLAESTTLNEKKSAFGYVAVPASAVCPDN